MAKVGTAPRRLPQRVFGVGHPEVDSHARMLLAKPGERGRHQSGARRGEVAYRRPLGVPGS